MSKTLNNKTKNVKEGRPPLGRFKRPQHSITFHPDHEVLMNDDRSSKKVTRPQIVEEALNLYYKIQLKKLRDNRKDN